MRNHSRGRTMLVLALASGLGAVGCGDDAQDTPTTPDVPAPIQSPAPAPSATPTPVPSPPTGTDPGEGVVFVGKIKAIVPPFLMVSAQEVLTDDQTIYERNGEAVTLSDLQLLEIVRVKGTIQDEQGTILATKIVV